MFWVFLVSYSVFTFNGLKIFQPHFWGKAFLIIHYQIKTTQTLHLTFISTDGRHQTLARVTDHFA